VQEKIVTAIRVGNYAQVAAVYAGTTERTYYRWMERGEGAQAGRSPLVSGGAEPGRSRRGSERGR